MRHASFICDIHTRESTVAVPTSCICDKVHSYVAWTLMSLYHAFQQVPEEHAHEITETAAAHTCCARLPVCGQAEGRAQLMKHHRLCV